MHKAQVLQDSAQVQGGDTAVAAEEHYPQKNHRTGQRFCFSAQIKTSGLFLYSHSPKIAFFFFFPTSLLLVLFTPAAWFPPL